MVSVSAAADAAGAVSPVPRTTASASRVRRTMSVPFACGHVGGKEQWYGREDCALAISNFLRQHDLVQVQWVFLSSVSGAPQRDPQDLDRVFLPCKSAPKRPL